MKVETFKIEKCKMMNKKEWCKSMTDTTHFKPNVNEFNDVVGASNNVGMYDKDEEIGKIRANLSNPKWDVTEKMEYAKSIYESTDGEIKEIIKAEIDKLNNEETTETTETTETNSAE